MMKGHLFSRRRILSALVLILAASALAIGLAWLLPHQLLTVDSGDVKADAIVVLGGGTNERPMRAAALYKDGAAPLVIVSGFGDGYTNAQIMERNGVPREVILLESLSLSTLENARFTVPLLRERGIHRVIIVTSWYHSRRALSCFSRIAPDIQFFSRPAYGTYPRAEWSRHGTSNYIRSEYLKLFGYWICYGVPPFPRS